VGLAGVEAAGSDSLTGDSGAIVLPASRRSGAQIRNVVLAPQLVQSLTHAAAEPRLEHSLASSQRSVHTLH
jgi:hypothetical protein